MIRFPAFVRLLISGACALLAITPASAQTVDLLGQKMGQKQAPGPARPPVRAGFKTPGPPENGPAPWITSVVEVGGDKDRLQTHRMYFPTKEKVDQVYYDVPVAVHVPFEIPFDGGVVNTFFDLDPVWGDPELKARLPQGNQRTTSLEEVGPPPWIAHSDGIYRLDGAPIAEGSVGWEFLQGDELKPGPFTWQTGGPFPVMFNGKPIESFKPGEGANPSRHLFSDVYLEGPRLPFAERTRKGGDTWRFLFNPVPIQFRNAKPGWYVMWFVISSPYPSGVGNVPIRPEGTVQATLRAHSLVTRLQRFRETERLHASLLSDELSYLWEGRGTRPERLSDERLVRAHTVEVPMTFHPDGWVLDRVEVRPGEARGYLLAEKAAKASTFTQYPTEISGEGKVSGAGATIKSRLDVFGWDYSSTPAKVKNIAQRDVNFEVRLPARIADGAMAEVTTTRTVTRAAGDSAALAAASDHLVLMRVSGSSDFNGAALDPIANSEYVPTKAQYLTERGWLYGDPDGRQWLPYVPQPPGSGVPWVFRFGVRRHRVMDAYSAENRRMLVEDIGTVKLFAVQCGAWVVEGHYRRWKDASRRGSAVNPNAVARVVEEKDPFWEWKTKFTKFVKEKTEVAEAAIERAKLNHPVMQSAKASAARLRLALTQNGQSVWDSILGDRIVSIPIETQHAMGVKNSELVFFSNEVRNTIKQDADTARAALRAIEAEVRRVLPDFQDRHPELRIWLLDYRRMADDRELQLAFLIDEPADFLKGIERLEAQGLSSYQRMLLSMVLFNSGDVPGAYWQAREATRSDPRSMAAQTRAAELECAILKAMIEKSHAGIHAARQQFSQFLEQRGFKAGDEGRVRAAIQFITTGAATGLAGALDLADAYGNEMEAVDRHLNNAYLGLKLIEGLFRRGHSMEKIRGMPEKPATPTTPAIPATGMKSEEMFEAMAKDAPNVPRPSARQMAVLGACVREALALPELAAIASGDRQALAAAMAAGYFVAKDVDKFWWEHFGDLASMANVAFTAAPNTYIARPGSKLPSNWFWSARETAIVGAAAERGLLAESVTMIAGRHLRIDRAVGALGSTKAGKYLLEMAQKRAVDQRTWRTAEHLTWGGAKVSAMFIGFGLAYQGADHFGGPGAVLALDALMAFAGDSVAMHQWLAASKINPVKTAEVLRRQFVPAATRRARQLGGQEADRQALKKIADKLRASLKLTEEDGKIVARHSTSGRSRVQLLLEGDEDTLLQTALGKIRDRQKLSPDEEALVLRLNIQIEMPAGISREALEETVSERDGLLRALDKIRKNERLTPGEEALLIKKNVAIERARFPTPSGEAGQAGETALQGIADGIERNTLDGAVAAADDVAGDVAAEARAAQQCADDAERIAKELEATAAANARTPPPERVVPLTNESGQAFRSRPAPQSDLARAEAALDAENFDEAEILLRRLIGEDEVMLQAGVPLAEHEYKRGVLERKHQIARAGLRSGKPAKGVPAALLKPIEKPEATKVLAAELAGELVPLELIFPNAKSGASGQILCAVEEAAGWPHGRPTHIVKTVNVGSELTPTPEHLQRLIEGEVVGAELMRELGFPAPALCAEMDPSGQSAKLIYRFVDGPTVNHLAPEQIHALRKELSKHRAFAVWVADYDRKLDNYMVIGGNLIPIDAGQADLRNVFDVPPDSLRGLETWRDLWYDDACKKLADPSTSLKDRIFAETHFAAETSLRAEHAAETLGKIGDLCDNDGAKLKEILGRAYRRLYEGTASGGEAAIEDMIKKASAVLIARNDNLGSCMAGLNARSGASVRANVAAPAARIARPNPTLPSGTTQKPPNVAPSGIDTRPPQVPPPAPANVPTRPPVAPVAPAAGRPAPDAQATPPTPRVPGRDAGVLRDGFPWRIAA